MFTFNIHQINDTQKQNNGSFLQTPFWCEFKSRHGWSYKRFEINAIFNETKKEHTVEVSVLNRNFCKNIFSIAYIPLFPKAEQILELMPEKDEDSDFTYEFAYYLEELSKSIKKYLPKNTIAIRFDPDFVFDIPEDRDEFNYAMKMLSYAYRLKLRKNKVDIQPPDSTLVDLTGTEEEILEKMHQKWRYNIRLSERKGVEIKRYIGNNINLSTKIDKFYELTKETNARDGNTCHAKAYYYDLIESSAKENGLKEGDAIPLTSEKPLVSLYIAEHEEDEIASIMTLFSKDEAIYLYGASSNNKRNLMPNHLLQWTAMKDAKAYGSKVYDMYGMPPEGKDENHPMHGLYMFKVNFGGNNVHMTGSWDVPVKFWYYLYSFVEKIRAFLVKKVLKKLKHR